MNVSAPFSILQTLAYCHSPDRVQTLRSGDAMTGFRTTCLPRLIQISATLGMATLGACSVSGSGAGAAAVSFSLPNGWSVDAVTYIVSSSDQELLLSGSEDVSAPNATLSLTLNLPLGRRDTLEIVARTASGTSCQGTSPPFDVVAGRPTYVSLVLSCGGVAPGSDSCPLVSVVAPGPAVAVAPTGAIDVAATASDSDPGDVPSFAWAAGAGSFDDPAAQSTRYICTKAGAQTLVLTVDDHHVPSSCAVTFLIPVTCLPNGDAGS